MDLEPGSLRAPATASRPCQRIDTLEEEIVEKSRQQVLRQAKSHTLSSPTRAALAAVLLTAALATVASGCGGSNTYSQTQVKSAFKSQGFRLTTVVVNGTKANEELEPAQNSGVPFFVVLVLRSDQEARNYFRGSQGQTFALALRKKNVVVVTKARDPDLRKRITLSIKSLH
jgi:hypothetical protein